MADKICYIKMNRNVEATREDIFFKDAGSILCEDQIVQAKVKALKLHHFSKNESRCVISILKIVELITQLDNTISVENLGEIEVIVERVKEKKTSKIPKIILVAAISFFGTAFTIMAYHNDIGISNVFARIYRIVMGEECNTISVLEVAYSLGLALGIILFFNHIGKKRITKDPTPIEVEMRKYEKDVNDTLVDTSEREGQTIDVS